MSAPSWLSRGLVEPPHIIAADQRPGNISIATDDAEHRRSGRDFVDAPVATPYRCSF
jgi:hypothetical protein